LLSSASSSLLQIDCFSEGLDFARYCPFLAFANGKISLFILDLIGFPVGAFAEPLAPEINSYYYGIVCCCLRRSPN